MQSNAPSSNGGLDLSKESKEEEKSEGKVDYMRQT